MKTRSVYQNRNIAGLRKREFQKVHVQPKITYTTPPQNTQSQSSKNEHVKPKVSYEDDKTVRNIYSMHEIHPKKDKTYYKTSLGPMFMSPVQIFQAKDGHYERKNAIIGKLKGKSEYYYYDEKEMDWKVIPLGGSKIDPSDAMYYGTDDKYIYTSTPMPELKKKAQDNLFNHDDAKLDVYGPEYHMFNPKTKFVGIDYGENSEIRPPTDEEVSMWESVSTPMGEPLEHHHWYNTSNPEQEKVDAIAKAHAIHEIGKFFLFCLCIHKE